MNSLNGIRRTCIRSALKSNNRNSLACSGKWYFQPWSCKYPFAFSSDLFCFILRVSTKINYFFHQIWMHIVFQALKLQPAYRVKDERMWGLHYGCKNPDPYAVSRRWTRRHERVSIGSQHWENREAFDNVYVKLSTLKLCKFNSFALGIVTGQHPGL